MYTMYFSQSLELGVVIEPKVFEEKLISEDPDFTETVSKLKTWNEGMSVCV